MVVVLIILNIILIVALVFLSLYIFKKNKNSVTHCETNVCVGDDECLVIKTCEHKQNNIESERVFDGVFITEEEYQQMMKERTGNISSLMDEVNKEYEHFKELNK